MPAHEQRVFAQACATSPVHVCSSVIVSLRSLPLGPWIHDEFSALATLCVYEFLTSRHELVPLCSVVLAVER